ncbi:hypothetical protein [Peribacillus simplex]|uniref:hypothetical protein n=1 Tax=Peribacillus simplex TaxID=1478 RepID=UPI0024C1A564|nr:hypothetical protein [Peribacillus simplex]WHX93021.1 hypothetical protein QNH50_09340 [Peribacillus simplex]
MFIAVILFLQWSEVPKENNIKNNPLKVFHKSSKGTHLLSAFSAREIHCKSKEKNSSKKKEDKNFVVITVKTRNNSDDH